MYVSFKKEESKIKDKKFKFDFDFERFRLPVTTDDGKLQIWDSLSGKSVRKMWPGIWEINAAWTLPPPSKSACHCQCPGAASDRRLPILPESNNERFFLLNISRLGQSKLTMIAKVNLIKLITVDLLKYVRLGKASEV